MKYIDADILCDRIKKNKYVIEPMFLKGDDSYYEGEYDGYNRILSIIDSLQQEQEENKTNLLKSLEEYFEKTPKKQLDADWEKLKVWNKIGPDVETYCKTQREHQEVDLEKFTEKMDAWKARYNYPDNIPIKATMAFTARMFYMYPNVAREWYESLPKVTQD